jgi:hypothetical protein
VTKRRQERGRSAQAAATEQESLEALRTTGQSIAAGVARELPGWVAAQVERILDAWGKADDDARAGARRAARDAGPVAAARVGRALEDLFGVDPAEQRSTPLAIVRTAYREPTEILTAVGVPDVVRDPFDERTLPEDRYDLAPRTLGDLGDPDLAPLHLAWGVAKARVLRARVT